MNLNDLLKQDSEWLKGTGPHANIVMSSRARLARNIEKIPFSNWANKKQLEDISSMVKAAASSINMLKTSTWIDLKNISEVDRFFLVERHLMSPEHSKDVDYKALIIDPKEILSIMVNEEDHIRMQVLQSGLNLKE